MTKVHKLYHLFPVAVCLLVLSLVQGALEASQAQPVICEGERTRKFNLPEELHRLERANPYEDFERDRKNGDLKFVGVWGLDLSFPGVGDRGLYQEIRNGTYDSWSVPGSDVIIGFEHHKLTTIAYDYAWIYNALLLNHLNKPFEPMRVHESTCNVSNVLSEGELTGISVESLDIVEAADASQDVCDAIHRSDFRFIAVRDGDYCVPQARHEQRLYQSQLKAIIDFNISSAPMDSYEYKRRLQVGRLYVSTYNRTLKWYLKEKSRQAPGRDQGP